MTASWLGRQLELEVGPVAHGGHFVARHESRVVFVRHALTGERVLAVVTEDPGGSFCRADAIEILVAAPDRVTPPCQHARPGGCGGCDFQHVALSRQRELKAQVVREQFRRLANLDVAVEVTPLSTDAPDTGLGWRRRVRYATDPAGRTGLRAHRSHEVVPIERCPLATEPVGDVAALESLSRPGSEIEVAQGDNDQLAVTLRTVSQPAGARRLPRRGSRRGARTVDVGVLGPTTLDYEVAGRRFTVQSGGFWQTHPGAAAEFCRVAEAQLALRPGENALDLYAGAGLFTALLAAGVTSSGRVVGLESDRAAAADGAANLADLPQAQLRRGSVTAPALRELGAELGRVDAIVLDPPRSGAGREVMTAITELAARVVVYVACDPAALARDVRTAADLGWRLDHLLAYDAFAMTHHVECVAVLRPPRSGPARSGVGHDVHEPHIRPAGAKS